MRTCGRLNVGVESDQNFQHIVRTTKRNSQRRREPAQLRE
jgi:hypothetical protein